MSPSTKAKQPDQNKNKKTVFKTQTNAIFQIQKNLLHNTVIIKAHVNTINMDMVT